MTLEKKTVLPDDETAMPTKIRVEDTNQYVCLLINRKSHRSSALECLKARSHSGIMGQFIFYDSLKTSMKRSLHLYILYTSESPQTIIDDCRSEDMQTAALSTFYCDLFRLNLEKIYHNHFNGLLPEPSKSSIGFSLPSLTIVHGKQKNTWSAKRFKNKAVLLQQSQKMNIACFVLHKPKPPNFINSCLACVSNLQEAFVLSTGRAVTKPNEESNEVAPVVQYLNYIFKNGRVSWSQINTTCFSKCGNIFPKESLDDCHPSITHNFYLPTQNQPLVQRLHGQVRKSFDKSSQQPYFCLWAHFKKNDRHKNECLNCLRIESKHKGKEMRLSRSTLLFNTSYPNLEKCVNLNLRCASLRNVSVDFCKYEEKLMEEHQPSMEKRKVVLGFDLNKSPPRETDFELTSSAMEQDITQSDTPPRELNTVQTSEEAAVVMHFETKGKTELITCFECLALYKEVLLISLDRAYLWLMNATKDALELNQCSTKCSKKGREQSISKEEAPSADEPESFKIEEWQMLQPLSSTNVASIFGEDSTAKECSDDDETSPDQPESHIAARTRKRKSNTAAMA